MSTLPMNQEDHPAHDIPDATQQYAGDVLPMPGDRSLGSGSNGVDPNSISYAVGSKKDPLGSWAGRTGSRTNGQ